jgi:hypothetical protein
MQPVAELHRNRTALTSEALRRHFGELTQQHNDFKAILRALEKSQNSVQTAQDQMAQIQEASRDNLMGVKHKTDAIW